MLEIIKVIHLESGEERMVKLSRFSPELHKKIGEVVLVGDDVRKPLKKLPEEKLEKSVDVQVKKAETTNSTDLLNVSEDKVKDLSWIQLRSLAKSMDIVSGSITRELLQAQVIDKINKLNQI